MRRQYEWSAEVAERLAKVAKERIGTHEQISQASGVPKPTVSKIMAHTTEPRASTLAAITAAAGVSVDFILTGIGGLDDDIRAVSPASIVEEYLKPLVPGQAAKDILLQSSVTDKTTRFASEPPILADEVFAIPALTATASAGDGSLIWGNEIGDAPFRFMEDWLRREFGSIAGLRLIQIRGDSQLPDLSDGDWAIIDTDQNRLENGLTVIRLDECLMIKRLHREGQFLQLISRNPIYAPTVIDLSKEQYRISVVGKVIYIFKSV